MLALIESYLDRIGRLLSRPQIEMERNRIGTGRLHSRLVASHARSLREAEFRVFSQFGEDGIIQYLIKRVPISEEFFVEIGVESYRESNTRFLLESNNWAGCIYDAGDAHSRFLRRRGLAWRHQIDSFTRFVDRDNINELMRAAKVPPDLGLLSLDIDGVDYWVLEALSIVQPRILVLEYNSVFGPETKVTVPYDPGFVRSKAHQSFLYWGASLAALDELASSKGYVLAGGNSAGNNAFWVRDDVSSEVSPTTVKETWVDARFRESKDRRGRPTYINDRYDRLQLIREMPVVLVDDGRVDSIASVYSV
jgi:hypothetical protein